MLMRCVYSECQEMAVFLRNNCSFAGCGQTFSKLSHLIHHIEDCHIASDPEVLEKQELQQPPSTNIGYILKFFDDTSKSDSEAIKRHYGDFTRPESPDFSQRSVTPVGSEYDGEDEEISVYSEDDDEDVIDVKDSSVSTSVAQEEGYSYELILGMVKSQESFDRDKPLKCPVNGCKKQYKNINGMKYHAKTAHKKDIGKMQSNFVCYECKRTYKTQHGLRNHFKSQHPHMTDIHIQFISTKSAILDISNQSTKSTILDLCGNQSAQMASSKRKISKSSSGELLLVVKNEDLLNQNVSMVTSEIESSFPEISRI